MHLIVGLGNPGNKYSKNRHNLGYIVADELAKGENLSWRYNPDWMAYYIKFRKQPAVISGVSEGKTEYILLKPSTFMNKSGEAVRHASNFFKITKKNIIAIHDDLDLPFGKIRLAFDGISAGHKGIDSMIESLGGVAFARLRIGIGKPARKSLTERYVLSNFSKEEQKELNDIVKVSKEAIKSYLADGIQATMNRFN